MNSNQSRSLRNIVMILVITGIMVLALGGYLTPLANAALSPVVNLQTWISVRYQALTDFINSPRELAALQERNEALEAEVAQLQAQIIELQQENSEIQVLSALVDFARAHPGNDYVAANVIGRDPSPFLQYILINRGSDDGIQRGMPVVTAQGLIGRVSAVTASAARVQLITDPAMEVNVIIQGSQINAILLGSLIGNVSLDMIPQNETVNVGDLILTSGLGGGYPPNILVGQVTGIRTRSFDLFQTASVQPVVDFSKMDIILVIRNFRSVDVGPLIP